MACLTRKELYNLVWSKPMSKLALDFGMSNVALKKKCEKYEIPTPGVGHWARIRAGYPDEREKLPPAPEGLGDEVEFDHTRQAQLEGRPPPPTVPVATKLVDPHPVVVWLEGALAKASLDRHGRHVVGYDRSPIACVWKPTIPRALLLLDALYKALERQGHKVEAKSRFDHSEYREMIITAQSGEVFAAEVETRLDRKAHVLTAEEREQQAKWHWSNFPKYDYFPSERIRVKLEYTHWAYTGQKSWSDSRTKRLEDLLGHFVRAVGEAAVAGHAADEAARRKQAERRVAELRRVRPERLAWYEAFLARDLGKMAARWRKAQRLRQFLAAYETALDDAERTPVHDSWIAAAKAYIEALDPLLAAGSVAKELEPSDEELAALWAEHGPRAGKTELLDDEWS